MTLWAHVRDGVLALRHQFGRHVAPEADPEPAVEQELEQELEPEYHPNIHERPTRRGPFSPWAWARNRRLGRTLEEAAE